MRNVFSFLAVLSLFAAGAIAGLHRGDPAPGYKPIDCRKPYPEICVGDWPETQDGQCDE